MKYELVRAVPFISLTDSSTTLYFRVVASEMLAIRSVVVMFDVWPVLMHLNLKMHLLQMTIGPQAAAVNDFLDLVQCRLGQKTNIQSEGKASYCYILLQNVAKFTKQC